MAHPADVGVDPPARSPSGPLRAVVVVLRLVLGTLVATVSGWLIVELLAPDLVDGVGQGMAAALGAPSPGTAGSGAGALGGALASLAQRPAVAAMLAAGALLGVATAVARWPSRRRPLAPFPVFATVAVLLAPPVLALPVGIFDEGFIAAGAMAILRGGLPINDFFVIYGPGQYYLTAGAFALLGEDLLVSRALHVVLLALLGLAVAACTSALVPRSRLWPVLATVAYGLLAAWLSGAPGYAAIPATACLLGACLAFAGWAGTGSRRRLFTASLLVGIAAVFRWDFGVFGGLAIAVTAAFMLGAERVPGAATRGTLAAALVPAGVVAAVLFGPFVAFGGAARWFDEVVLFHLFEFTTWRRADIVAPTLRGLVTFAQTGASPGSTARAALQLAYLATAFGAAAVTVVVAGRRMRRGPVAGRAADTLALLLGLVVLLLMNQVRTRAGFPQGFPAVVATLPLLAYLGATLPRSTRVQRTAVAVLGGGMAAALVVVPLVLVLPGLRGVTAVAAGGDGELRRATVLQTAAASKTRSRGYAELVRHLDTTTRPGEPIVSAAADMSRLFVNDAMLYFLAARPAGTRWIEMEPGLTNTEKGQRELVDEMERQQVRTVVLLSRQSDEPNATARSNGVHLFDEHVRRTFVSSRRFGDYEVLVRRAR